MSTALTSAHSRHEPSPLHHSYTLMKRERERGLSALSAWTVLIRFLVSFSSISLLQKHPHIHKMHAGNLKLLHSVTPQLQQKRSLCVNDHSLVEFKAGSRSPGVRANVAKECANAPRTPGTEHKLFQSSLFLYPWLCSAVQTHIYVRQSVISL